MLVKKNYSTDLSYFYIYSNKLYWRCQFCSILLYPSASIIFCCVCAGVLSRPLPSSQLCLTQKLFFHPTPEKPKKTFFESFKFEIQLFAAFGVAVISYYFYEEYKKISDSERPSALERKGEPNILQERPPQTNVAKSVSCILFWLSSFVLDYFLCPWLSCCEYCCELHSTFAL